MGEVGEHCCMCVCVWWAGVVVVLMRLRGSVVQRGMEFWILDPQFAIWDLEFWPGTINELPDVVIHTPRLRCRVEVGRGEVTNHALSLPELGGLTLTLT